MTIAGEKLVRDFRWVLESPSLLAATPKLAFNQQCLNKLEKDPTPLEAYLVIRPVTQRLGLYFENLVAFFLSEVAQVKNFARNVPVRSNGVTQGEFDFLFDHPTTGQPTHWEAAVKFYLYAGPEKCDPHRFFGPAGKDRLDLKLRKIFDHQLKLGGDKYHAEAFVKGRLFYPLTTDWQNHPSAPGLSPRHLRGWWGTLTEVSLIEDPKFAILEKPNWLSDHHVFDEHELLNIKDLSERCLVNFKESERSILVAAMKKSEDGSWIESSRGFVVHPDWLRATAKSG